MEILLGLLFVVLGIAVLAEPILGRLRVRELRQRIDQLEARVSDLRERLGGAESAARTQPVATSAAEAEPVHRVEPDAVAAAPPVLAERPRDAVLPEPGAAIASRPQMPAAAVQPIAVAPEAPSTEAPAPAAALPTPAPEPMAQGAVRTLDTPFDDRPAQPVQPPVEHQPVAAQVPAVPEVSAVEPPAPMPVSRAPGYLAYASGRYGEPVTQTTVSPAPSLPAGVEAVPEAVLTESRAPLLKTIRAWLKELARREEWEAIIGGSWLNKVGVFVLVIGLALFLGYSFRYLGPAGRIAIGLALSAATLIGGVVLERRVRYVIFARGLIGGGWAGVYFTTYAMHGLEAARVVEDPMIGMILLVAAAAGMIVHSLRYRSEAVTGLAYLSGFVAIAISPVSGFSVIASVPLAGSLLFVAQRFGWTTMVVCGVIGTYGIYALKYGSVAQSGAHPGDFASGQATLVIYWLMFEFCDIADMLRRRQAPGLARAIFPLNACGFVGMSLLFWPASAQQTLYAFLAATGAAYLLSAVVRAKVRPPSSFGEDAVVVDRMVQGGYEAAVTLSVILVTAGMFQKFSGLDLNLALLIEGEFLFLAGLRLNQPFLRMLAGVVFVIPFGKLVTVDMRGTGQMALAGTSQAWTPYAGLMAALFYLNRWLASRTESLPRRILESGYGGAATALVVLMLWFEWPRGSVAIAYLVFALPLFEIGLRKGFEEFRTHSYVVGMLGFGIVLMVNIADLGMHVRAVDHIWNVLLPAAIITYLAAARAHRLVPERLPESERARMRVISSWAGTACLAALIWHALPRAYLGLGWLVLAVPLFEMGLYARLHEVRVQSYIVGGAALAALAQLNLFHVDVEGALHPWVALAPAALLIYGAAARAQLLPAERLPDVERAWVRLASTWSGTALVAGLLWRELPHAYLGLGWMAMAAPLFEIGLRVRLGELKTQSYVMATVGLAAVFGINILSLEFGVVAHPWFVLGAAAILSYAATARFHGLASGWLPDTERCAVREISSGCGTVLVAWLAWYSLPSAYVGLGWLLIAVPLFEVGLSTRLAGIRVQAYLMAIAGITVLGIVNVFGLEAGDTPDPWIMLAPAAVLAYACVARMVRLAPERLDERERVSLRDWSSITGTAMLALLCWYALPSVVVAVAWSTISLVLFELGCLLEFPLLRRQASLALALAFGRLFLANFTVTGETLFVSHRALTVVPVIVLFYYLWARLNREMRQGRVLSWERSITTLYLYAPAVLAVALIRFEAGRVLAVAGWALLGIGLLVAGIRLNNRDLRWQSYVVAMLTFGRCWATNFYIPESLAGAFGRVFAGTLVTLSFFASQFLSPRRGDQELAVEGTWLRRILIRFDAHGRTAFALLAIILMTLLIFYEVSGNLLTVAWALEGAMLLGVGFAAHERVMRLSGLALLAVCIVKVFAYDFQQLDALFRILSFIVLGLLLLGVSLLYTRFREQLKKYL